MLPAYKSECFLLFQSSMLNEVSINLTFVIQIILISTDTTKADEYPPVLRPNDEHYSTYDQYSVILFLSIQKSY